jgi:rubredoxin
METEFKRVRILRTCPRCHARNYHWQFAQPNQLKCNECGHVFKIRLTREEKGAE